MAPASSRVEWAIEGTKMITVVSTVVAMWYGNTPEALNLETRRMGGKEACYSDFVLVLVLLDCFPSFSYIFFQFFLAEFIELFYLAFPNL